MGLSVGADMLDVAYIKATYGFRLNPRHIDEQSQLYWSGGIIVNKAPNDLLTNRSPTKFLRTTL